MQTVPRSVTLRRATLLPLALAGLSLWGVASTFASVVALPGWALGLAAALTLQLRLGIPPGARWSATEQRFELPGSWVPLAQILGIFATRYAVGVIVALHPQYRADTVFAVGASLAYGTLSGFFLGRAAVLWRAAPRLRGAAGLSSAAGQNPHS